MLSSSESLFRISRFSVGHLQNLHSSTNCLPTRGYYHLTCMVYMLARKQARTLIAVMVNKLGSTPL